MRDKKVLIGSVRTSKEQVMYNMAFQYAANFEQILVPAGEYPIYAYEDDIDYIDGCYRLGWRNYIGWEGTVMAGNVGGKPGEHTYYHEHVYNYQLADYFLHGHDEHWDDEYKLYDNWTLKISECEYDGERLFSLSVVKKGE